MTDGIKPEESKKSLIQTPIINQAGPIDLTTPHDGQPYADSSHSQTNTPSLPQHLLNHPSDTRDTESATQDAHKPHPELVQIELVKLEDEPPDQPGQLDNDPLSSQTVLDPADALGGAADDSHEWVVENDSEMKRVKVYELVGSRWVDRGTAFCFGHFSQDGTEALLTARSEKNVNEVILSTTIRSSDVYQHTLIVWTEPNGIDYALSFQDADGCAEVWSFIQEVQRHMNGPEDQVSISLGPSSPIIGQESTSVTTQSVIRSGHLPPPQMGIISDIERAIKGLARTQIVKERICEYIQQEDYIKQMIDVLTMAEDMESLDSLHALCSLMQTILMLNDHSMYEHIVEDDIFLGVVGMLEYDPEFPTYKANYREFLSQSSQFHHPIPIRDTSIQRKIHHTYRLQFLKDVVLARALDDATFSVLNACIIFNQTDIVNHVQQDIPFLREVVGLYVDEDTLSGGGIRKPMTEADGTSESRSPSQTSIGLPDPESMDIDNKSKVNGSPSDHGPSSQTLLPPEPSPEHDLHLRREVIILLQQLCAMGKNVQLQARMGLFRTLVDRGVLFAVQWALDLPETEESSKPLISAGGEILAALLDHDLNGVRGHVLKQVGAIERDKAAGKQGSDQSETLLQTVCRVMANSRDLAIQSQIGEALRSWLDIPPAVELATTNPGTEAAAGGSSLANKFGVRKDDPGTERFMEFFYKDCIAILFKPLYTLEEWKNVTASVLQFSREHTNRLVYLCDLLYSFSVQHHFRSHFFIMSSSIVTRVATLLKARDKHLRHAAFRFFRLLLKQNNPNMHVQIMKYDILKPILDLTIQESRRDNLLSCSCQEYFEHMRRENMKDMIKFCMTNHETEVKTLAESPLGGQRFQMFIRRWEMNNEPPPTEVKIERPPENRGWPGQGRAPDSEEENYFNADDDDDGFVPSINSQAWSRTSGASSPMPSLKRKRRPPVIGPPPKGLRLQGNPQALSRLSDYGDEDEEEEDSTWPSRPSPSPTQGHFNAAPSEITSSSVAETELAPSMKTINNHDNSPNVPKSLDPEQNGTTDQATADTQLIDIAPPGRPRPKRQRTEDDDDDELMARLTKLKRPDLGSQKGGNLTKLRPKPEDLSSKKFKLKIGKALTTTSPPEAITKDGDRG